MQENAMFAKETASAVRSEFNLMSSEVDAGNEYSSYARKEMADGLDYALLKNNAKANRQAMTEAEKVFWSVVKSNGIGEKCRRQYIIGTYIVDFFFRSSMLIVEIDGGYHSTEQQKMMDSQRQEYLESKGCKVLRFTNEEVLFQLDKVIETVKENLTSTL